MPLNTLASFDPFTAMEIIDISVPISPNMPIFPGDPGVSFTPALDMHCGGPANVTIVQMGSQTGTHVDTPHHILNNGLTTNHLPLQAFYGPAQVVALPDDVTEITPEHYAAQLHPESTRVLFKTKNSARWQQSSATFATDFAALTHAAADDLVARGVQLVGIDALSVELYGSPTMPAHHSLLQSNVVILEGLNLSHVEPGIYTLSAFPIKYDGLDGAPVRAVLLRPSV